MRVSWFRILTNKDLKVDKEVLHKETLDKEAIEKEAFHEETFEKLAPLSDTSRPIRLGALRVQGSR